MLIKSLSISHFMGIEELSLDLPSGGAIIEGGNGRGKTSILKAIQAALAAQGVAPSAVRKGAKKAEVLIDLGAVKVRRSITAEGGGALKVSDGATGAVYPSPATFLANLLGASPLDPLRLFLADDEEQKKIILQAIPCSVSLAQIQQWAPGLPKDTVAEALALPVTALPAVDEEPLPGHGLEVVGRIRKLLYGRRAAANKAVEAARRDADFAMKSYEGERERFARSLVEDGFAADALPEREQATKLIAQAMAESTRLVNERREAERKRSLRDDTAKKIDRLRDDAAARRRTLAPGPIETEISVAQSELRAAESAVDGHRQEVLRLRALLTEAENLLKDREHERDLAERQLSTLRTKKDAAEREERAIRALEEQADDLGKAMGGAIHGPTEEEIEKARAEVERVERLHLHLAKKEELEKRRAARDQTIGVLEGATTRAALLDQAVRALADDAPAALLSQQNGIPGLILDGDDVTIDGISISRISGRERMVFAVKIARRLAGKSRFLIVDGLEAIDPDNLEDFIREATADGFQLIATRVGRGDAEMRPIEGGEETR